MVPNHEHRPNGFRIVTPGRLSSRACRWRSLCYYRKLTWSVQASNSSQRIVDNTICQHELGTWKKPCQMSYSPSRKNIPVFPNYYLQIISVSRFESDEHFSWLHPRPGSTPTTWTADHPQAPSCCILFGTSLSRPKFPAARHWAWHRESAGCREVEAPWKLKQDLLIFECCGNSLDKCIHLKMTYYDAV